MSQKDVDLIKWGMEAFNRRDWDAALELIAEDAVWTTYFATVAGEKSRYGRAAIRRAWEEAAEVFGGDAYQVEPRDFRDLGGGTILVAVRLTGQGTESGVEVETEYAQLWTLRLGLAVRVDSYGDVAEALKAAGLSEAGASQPPSRDTARAMSQENVEIVKGIYSRWENGDFAHTEWAAPDFEFRAEETSPHGAPRTDLAGMQIQWRDFLEAWADVRASPDEIIEAGDRVVVLTRFSGRGKVSGVPMEQMEAGAVFTMSEGKVVQLVLYTSRSKALEAAGLSERDGP